MKSYVLLLLLFAINKIIFVNCLFKNMTNNEFSLYSEILVQILAVCHKNFKTIAIYGENSEHNLQPWINEISISQIRLDKFAMKDNSRKSKLSKMWNVDAFIILLPEKNEIVSILTHMKLSRWWDNLIPFYILSKASIKCEDRYKVLKTAWKMHLLTVNFLCVTGKNERLIFTYNPYANYAPHWQETVTQTNLENEPYKFFTKVYENENICQGLDFDRTKYLNKTIMKTRTIFNDIAYKNTQLRVDSEFYNESRLKALPDGLLIIPSTVNLLQTNLNVNYQLQFVSLSEFRGDIGMSMVKNKNFVDLITVSPVNYITTYGIVYPYKQREYCIISHYQGYQNFLQQIYNLLGVWLIAFMSGLLILTFLVIWCSHKQKKMGFAIFEILRLLVNASLTTEMNTLSMRIFFTMVFFYFLIIQALLQGELAKFLTNPALNKLANTLHDLKDNSYKTIYFQKSVQAFIVHESELTPKMKMIPDAGVCGNLLVANNHAACIIDKSASYVIAFHQSVYESPYSVHKKYEFFIVDHDSPLKDRINKGFLLMWELGWSGVYNERFAMFMLANLKRKKAANEFIKQPIMFKSIFPIVIFLMIGLTCGTICFVIELIYNYIKSTGKPKIPQNCINFRCFRQGKYIRQGLKKIISRK